MTQSCSHRFSLLINFVSDEKKIAEILGSISQEQRLQLVEAYNSTFSRVNEESEKERERALAVYIYIYIEIRHERSGHNASAYIPPSRLLSVFLFYTPHHILSSYQCFYTPHHILSSYRCFYTPHHVLLCVRFSNVFISLSSTFFLHMFIHSLLYPSPVSLKGLHC